MTKADADRMLIALITEVDYDIAKNYDPELSEEPDNIERRMERLRGIVAKYVKIEP